MASKRFDKGSYAGKDGGHKKGHPLGPATKEKSKGAIRQEYGLPYEPAPPRGFRPSDEGKDVFPNRGERGSRSGVAG